MKHKQLLSSLDNDAQSLQLNLPLRSTDKKRFLHYSVVALRTLHNHFPELLVTIPLADQAAAVTVNSSCAYNWNCLCPLAIDYYTVAAVSVHDSWTPTSYLDDTARSENCDASSEQQLRTL